MIHVTNLTKEQFVTEMRRQDALGKHGMGRTNHTLTDWKKVADYAEKFAKGESPFVLVDSIKIANLRLKHNVDESLVDDYQKRTTPIPPIFISLTNYSLKRQVSNGIPLQAEVINGHHRIASALLRQISTLPAIMSRESWNNYRIYLLGEDST